MTAFYKVSILPGEVHFHRVEHCLKSSYLRKEQTDFKLKKRVIRLPLQNDYTWGLFQKIILEFNDHQETDLIPKENDYLNS